MENQPEKKQEPGFLEKGGGKTVSNAIEIPSISVPKGGGAIKGIDEKFTVNAVNGTASFSVPLPFSKARGAVPEIALSYNSGTGNGIFGMGWSLDLPTIKRKTDDGLPRYKDGSGSTVNSGGAGGTGDTLSHPGNDDVFVLAGSEDLVPEFRKEPDGSFSRDTRGKYIIRENPSADGHYTIRYYRPRIEGLFARIERWSNKDEVMWRVTSKENVTTLYGWTPASRIAGPVRPGITGNQENNKDIFEWMPEFVFDDKGNCTHYIYKQEDESGLDTTLAHNRNRVAGGKITYTNLYPEKILYGNKTPYIKPGDPFPPESDYLFSTVFDYGEFNDVSPFNKINQWNFRSDPFSSYRAGFEIRTTRLCKRIFLFHHFRGAGEYEGLVKSLDFGYGSVNGGDLTFLESITTTGYIRKDDGSYSITKLPPVEFDYQKHEWNSEVKTPDPSDIVNAPSGVDQQEYRFTDLFNEGLPGILTEQGSGWYYKHNLGDGKFERAKMISPKPSLEGLGQQLTLTSLDGDGSKQLVSFDNQPRGFYEIDETNQWKPFRTFKALPNIETGGAYTRMIDLNGNGRADLLITENDLFTWYPSEGRDGFAPARQVPFTLNEEDGPRLIFADNEQKIFLADMSGDGLTDIVRIRNSEVCYWPNLGYGHFGKKVAMDNAPLFDHPEIFNPRYIRLADIDGSGTTDIVYLGKNKFTCWLNLSGNSFGKAPFEIGSFPAIHDQSVISIADLPGNGLACIVWSSPLPADSRKPLRYIDLMDGKKPHLMIGYRTNLGKEVSFEYTPSTKFYLKDKKEGKPWVTRLHFPVHCVSKTITEDKISNHVLISRYSYHHGYFDHPEKEFRGFGMVEQTDSEHTGSYVKADQEKLTLRELDQDPVVKRSWFHTGVAPRGESLQELFADNYWYNELRRNGILHTSNHEKIFTADEITVPQEINYAGEVLSSVEMRQAYRSAKSTVLRTELFTKDAIKNGDTPEARRKELIPFIVTSHNFQIELIQPKGFNRHAVFRVREKEALTYNYERDPDNPRMSHQLTISADQYGNPLESVSVFYPRLVPDTTLTASVSEEQNKTVIIYTRRNYTNDIIEASAYRLRMPSEVETWELKGVPISGDLYGISDFDEILSDARSTTVPYHQHDVPLTSGKAQKRLIEHVRLTYYANNLTGPLPLHQLESLALPYENYQLALTPALLADIYGPKVDDEMMAECKYTHSEGDNNWWIGSGIISYLENGETVNHAVGRFFSPVSYKDSHGAVTRVIYYGNYFLLISETIDALGNRNGVVRFNFRTLTPAVTSDINSNLSSVITDELGFVKAIALSGKGTEADDLNGLDEYATPAETTLISGFFNTDDSVLLTSMAKDLLQHSTKRFVYDLEAWRRNGKPPVVAVISREEHFQQNSDSNVQMIFEYSNGSGQVIMKKDQAEPGKVLVVNLAPDNSYSISETDTAAMNPRQLRWRCSARSIHNSKGNPVKQFEPYFSISPWYDDQKEISEGGVYTIFYYDSLDRLIKKEMPDGTFTKTEYGSWHKSDYDAGDTALESDWYNVRVNRLIDARLIAADKDPAREEAAAHKASEYANTPAVHHLNAMGRPVLSVKHNRDIDTGTSEFYHTIASVDTEGNLRSVTDARGNLTMQYKYDMLGNIVCQESVDSGKRWMLLNVSGNPLWTWDERGHEFRHTLDILQRTLHSRVTGGDGPVPLDHIYHKIIWGEQLLLPGRSNETDLKNRNVIGKPVKQYDSGGLVHTPEYDFKGLPLDTKRRLFIKYKETANWPDSNPDADLEAEEYIFRTETDALGRIKLQVTPDNSIVIPSYNEAGLLKGKNVRHHGASTDITYIKEINYNEKRQRNRVIYGNDVIKRYYYDSETFRLNRLETIRHNGDPVTDWRYTFDPAGNITHIEDKNVPVVFFNNQKISGLSEYTYDALYRLVKASGRENDTAFSHPANDNWNDFQYIKQKSAGDPMQVRNYTQLYSYDTVGNILETKHSAPNNSWTRNYTYENTTNRLKLSTVGGHDYNFQHHDTHGFINGMSHLEQIHWNFRDRLVSTVRQKLNNGGTPETTWYQYDEQGKRIRKITDNMASAGHSPTKKEERIYIAGFEIYRKYSNPNGGLERVSLSLSDQGHRYVIIETRNDVDDGSAKHLVRYQHHNHLGSASIELDENASVISYEEYHPFGTTAWQANNSAIRAAAKRYRFTGMERDEESGLNYHTARYYMPWLGRWLSPDPVNILPEDPVSGFDNYSFSFGSGAGINGGDAAGKGIGHYPESVRTDIDKSGRQSPDELLSVTAYEYCANNPISYIDPGGKDAILIVFPDYMVDTETRLGRRQLGHAGVLLINNETGYTRYYEYGRYPTSDGTRGRVRNQRVSNVTIGSDGRPTERSLNRVLQQISRSSGQGGRIEGAYIESDDFDVMNDYAEQMLRESTAGNPQYDPDRDPYSLLRRNCGTFARDVINQDPDVQVNTYLNTPGNIAAEFRNVFDKVDYSRQEGTTVTETRSITERVVESLTDWWNN